MASTTKSLFKKGNKKEGLCSPLTFLLSCRNIGTRTQDLFNVTEAL